MKALYKYLNRRPNTRSEKLGQFKQFSLMLGLSIFDFFNIRDVI